MRSGSTLVFDTFPQIFVETPLPIDILLPIYSPFSELIQRKRTFHFLNNYNILDIGSNVFCISDIFTKSVDLIYSGDVYHFILS